LDIFTQGITKPVQLVGPCYVLDARDDLLDGKAVAKGTQGVAKGRRPIKTVGAESGLVCLFQGQSTALAAVALPGKVLPAGITHLSLALFAFKAY